MRRLRQKLDEYYRLEGATDPLRVVIPRGHYHVEFRSQVAMPLHVGAEPAESVKSRSRGPARLHRGFLFGSFWLGRWSA